MIGPGLYHAKSLRVFAATLEAAQFVLHLAALERVLDAELLLQKVTVLAAVLPECLLLLLKLLSDVYIMVRRRHPGSVRSLKVEHRWNAADRWVTAAGNVVGARPDSRPIGELADV